MGSHAVILHADILNYVKYLCCLEVNKLQSVQEYKLVGLTEVESTSLFPTDTHKTNNWTISITFQDIVGRWV